MPVKKIILNTCLLVIVFSFQAKAQSTDTRPGTDRVSGGLLYIYQYTEIQGTAFLNDQWQTARIILDNGGEVKSAQLKFDTYSNKFIFLRNDSSFELSSKIKAVIFYPDKNDTTNKMIFKQNFAINGQINVNKYIQVLAEGKISLLKVYVKDIEEYTEYGNANKFKRFNDREQYFIYENGQYNSVNISKKNFEKLLKGKSAELDNFIKQKDLSGKEEKDWVDAIEYYDRLK